MSTNLSPLSLLESIGIPILQQAADAALGSGVLKVSDDASGVSIGVTLTSGQTLNADDLMIGSAGFSGHLFVDGLDTNPLSATLFDGFDIALTAFDITFAQGGLASSHIGGHLTMPFFTDDNGNPETVDVEVSTKHDGSISVSLSAVETLQNTTSDGLIQLIYKLPSNLGKVEIDVASVEIDKDASGTWCIIISGNLIIDVAGLAWPTIELRGLGIDSKGHISLEGGWINLPNQMSLDYFGFHVALQALGFGNDASGKWIGFNGDIHLVEGLSLGGSVRGMKLNLTTGALSFDGVGISFSIPDVLDIEGEIDHIHVEANTPNDLLSAGLNPTIFNAIAPVGPAGPKKVDVFAGMVKVSIIAAGDLEVDANFIVGNFGGQSVFFLDLDVDLPVGIPIFLDVSLYGLEGLIATGLDPEPQPPITWWDWYKYPNGPSGPNLNGTPDYTASDFNKWLVPKSGAFAIGAGATIGTSADDGYVVSAAITFVLLLPGPVISLIGKANILSKRISGANQDANFEAMAVYDGNTGTFDLNIDAQYQIPMVLDIEATAELFVDPGTPEWYFAMGKPPHDQRVKVRIFDIFETDGYFVVSNQGLITGTWTGYSGSWSFGPLSASLDAYLATLAAIQWSPLQIAGGIELHGSIQLSAFGIGVGISADALIEGCAPNPFYVHGELSVELDLPWPLPNVGGTISLTWGGDDGTIPPVPLALSHIDVGLSDHCDSASKPASDHYVLLAHRTNGPFPDATVQYTDPNVPAILNLTGQSLTNWQARVAQPLPAILPDLTPDNNSATQMAPVVPQDSHFVLNFSHPTLDLTGGFLPLPPASLPPEAITTPPPPPPKGVGQDDMSNINPDPPSVQFVIRHSLVDVTLFSYDGSNWTTVCSVPPQAPSEQSAAANTTYLSGVWISQPAKGQPTPNSTQLQLRIVPWSIIPGQTVTPQWSSQSQLQINARAFTDQGLKITHGEGIETPTISGGSASLNQKAAVNAPPGLSFASQSKDAQTVTIRFPQPTVVSSITALPYVEGPDHAAVLGVPQFSGDGNALTPHSTSQDMSSGAWTLNYPNTSVPVTELTVALGPNGSNAGPNGGSSSQGLILYSLDYAVAPVPMAILPDTPGFYALRVTTKIEAGRVTGGSPAFQDAPNGNPIVEFVYFQTSAGPGTGQIGAPFPPQPLLPTKTAEYPQLAANCSTMQQPTSASPLAGALEDLHTYTQWSWPPDGSVAAYYGYDVNVEFVETYVNALYTAFGDGFTNTLHFRCVDRNQNHTLLQVKSIHVPSIPQQSALVAGAIEIDVPRQAQPPTTGTIINRLTKNQWALLEKRAAAAPIDVNGESASTPFLAERVDQSTLSQVFSSLGRGSGLGIQQIDPGKIGGLIHELEEERSAAKVQQIWFRPLVPKMRYTLDVVAGPWMGQLREERQQPGSLLAVFRAPDAIGVLAALEAYYAHEDELSTLQRVQFTTSRYRTFSDQMSNVVSQLGGESGATPIRHYKTNIEPVTWLNTPGNNFDNFRNAVGAYMTARKVLAGVVESLDPLADDLYAGAPPAPTNGNAALVTARQGTTQTWQAVQQISAQVFDGLIAALGRPDLVSNQKPVAVPDTEITLFTNESERVVKAILLESPEAFPWRRIWQWMRLIPANRLAGGLDEAPVIWNADGTRGLIVPIGSPHGVFDLSITFQGNIGAEAPCITQNGGSVFETALLGTLTLGIVLRRPVPAPVPVRPVNPNIKALSPKKHGAVGSPAKHRMESHHEKTKDSKSERPAGGKKR